MLIVNRLIVLPTAYEETTITMINSYIHTSTTTIASDLYSDVYHDDIVHT
jgi:hypothetical protein